jgi:hypothetical protein
MSTHEVPHDLLIAVNSELVLEEKARRLAALILKPTKVQVYADLVRDIVLGLTKAHQKAFGRSNLTAWRIVNEWNDRTALFQLASYWSDDPAQKSVAEAFVTQTYNRNQNPKP